MNQTRSFMRISLLLLLTLFIFSSPLIVSSVHADDKQVKIGVLAKRGAKHCLQKWAATAEYLSQNISDYSFSIVPLSFNQLIPVTEKGEIDFVMSNSSYYVILEINQRVNRLVNLINKDVDNKPMTTFAGTHDAAVYAVRDDQTDVGCVRTSTLERMAEEGKISLADFKIIH